MDLSVLLKKRMVREILLLFLLTLILEVFLFNNRSFSTAGYDELILDDSYSVKIEGGSLNGNGDIVMEGGAESVTLEIDGFGYPLKNIMIDVECMDDTVTSAAIDHVCIVEGTSFDDAILELVDDDKNSNLVYGTIMSFKNDVLHTVPDSQYIYLKPFGNTKKLKLIISPASGVSQRLRIHKLVFNASRPIRISFIRVLAVFSALLLLYFSLYNTMLFDTDCITMGKWKKTAVILFPAVFACFFVIWHLTCGDLEWTVFLKILLGVVMVILAGILLLTIIRKHYRNISFASFMLMWGAAVCGMYLPAIMTCGTLGNAAGHASVPVFMPYVIVGAFYEYLLKPAVVDFGFPFTGLTIGEKINDAGMNMHVEMIGGGLIAANPFVWSLLLTGHYRSRLKDKKLLSKVIACIALAIVVMLAITAGTGSVRFIYTLGFTPLIIAGALILILEIQEDVKGISNERSRSIAEKCVAFVLLVSIFWGVAQIGCVYDDRAGMAINNTEMWYRLYYAFRIM